MKAAFDLASTIASKSPVAVQGTKIFLNYSRDHAVADSLNFAVSFFRVVTFQATWNMSQLQSNDVMIAAMAAINKEKKPIFAKL